MIDQYLAELRGELAGADPALVQDALYDAEEYLRTEMAEVPETEREARWSEVVERYGTPDEVAAAYREAEITVAMGLRPVQAPRSERRGFVGSFFGVLADPVAYGALFYLFLSFLTGIVYFTFVATMLGLGIGLLPVFVGSLILLLFFAMVRAIALAEGRMIEGLLDVRMPRRPRSMLREGDMADRLKHWFTDRRTWTSVLYLVLQLPLGVTYFSIMVTAIVTSLAAIAAPIAQALTGEVMIRMDGYGYLLEPWAIPLVVIGGVLGLVVTLHLGRGIGKLHGAYAKAMLVGRYSDMADAA